MPGKDRSARAAIFITASYAWAAITRNCSHDTRQLFFHLANLTYLTSLGAGLQTSLLIQILSTYFSIKTFQPLSRLLDQGSRAPKSTFHTICTPPRVFLAFTRGRVKWRLVAPRLSQTSLTKLGNCKLWHLGNCELKQWKILSWKLGNCFVLEQY